MMNIEKIKQDLTKILVSAHTHPKKHEIKQDKSALHFACPVCGDSDKDLSKKRGRIITSKAEPYFYCHHECGGMPINKFYAHFGLKWEDDIFTFFDGPIAVKQKYSYDAKKMSLSELSRLAVDMSDILKAFGLIRIKLDSPVYKYLQSRHIEEYVDYMAYSPKWKRLIIFNPLHEPSEVRRWNVDGYYNEIDYKVLGFQARDLTGKNSSKYLTYSLEKIRTECGYDWNPKAGCEEYIKQHCNTFFATLVDINQPIYIVEGPLDALFIKNAIALTGASKKARKLDSNSMAQYIFDADPTGKQKQSEKMLLGKKVFDWYSLKAKIGNQGVKDINDVVNHCINNNLEIPDFTQYFV